MNWHQYVRQLWQQRSLATRLLWPASVLSALYVWRKTRRAQRDAPTRAPLPVIVVGNVVVGGAGKTPTCLALAGALTLAGEYPVIISKGHGRRPGGPVHRWVGQHDDAADVGDEPLLMAQAKVCPILVTQQRADAIAWLERAAPEVSVVLCDDGLQDTTLAADLELVLFDARGVGNGWLLPAGPLREPWPRKRWRSKANTLYLLQLAPHEQAPPLVDLAGPLWVATRQLKPQLKRLDDVVSTPLSRLASGPCQALAGIAKPEQFFAMLQHAGVELKDMHTRPDHAPLEKAYEGLQADLPVIITAKDAVKCQSWPQDWQARTWVLQLDFTLPSGMVEKIAQCVQTARADLSSRHG